MRGKLIRTYSNSTLFRSAIAIALAAAFILVWLSFAVDTIGKDGDPANYMYFGVIAVGIIGTMIAWCNPMKWHVQCTRWRSIKGWALLDTSAILFQAIWRQIL